MYQISKKGLWYRIHKLFNTEEYKGIARCKTVFCNDSMNFIVTRDPIKPNICPWFWKGLFGLLLIVVLTPLVLLATIIIGYALASTVTVLLLGAFIQFDWVNPEAVMPILGIFSALAFFLGVDLHERGKIVPTYMKKWFIRDSQDDKTNKEPTLLATYYNAWKAKMCIQLDIKED